MKKGRKVVGVHKNGLGDYEINMKIRSQVDMSGIINLVQEMFEQSELYGLVKYNKPYLNIKRIDSGEEISQGYYDEKPEEIIPKKFKPYKPLWSTEKTDNEEEYEIPGFESKQEKPTYNATSSKPHTFPCRSCTKVDEECIPTNFEGGGCGECPKYEDRVWANILKNKEVRSQFEINKEPTKDRHLTNKELAMWLAQGKGLAMDKGTGRKSTSYDYWEEDKMVDYMNLAVRKWEDDNWHKPTYNYCFGDK